MPFFKHIQTDQAEYYSYHVDEPEDEDSFTLYVTKHGIEVELCCDGGCTTFDLQAEVLEEALALYQRMNHVL